MVSRTDWHCFLNCPERASCKEGCRQALGWCTMSPTPPNQHLQPGLSGASPAEQWAYQSQAGPRPYPDSTHPSWLEEVPLAPHTVLDVDQLLQVFLWAGTGDGHPSTPLPSAVYPLQGGWGHCFHYRGRKQSSERPSPNPSSEMAGGMGFLAWDFPAMKDEGTAAPLPHYGERRLAEGSDENEGPVGDGSVGREACCQA